MMNAYKMAVTPNVPFVKTDSAARIFALSNDANEAFRFWHFSAMVDNIIPEQKSK